MIRPSRRRGRILAVLLVFITTVIWVKLGAVLLFSGLGEAAWADENYRDSRDHSSVLLVGNVLEEHKAHFNLGTAEAAQGNLEDARQSLQVALRLSSDADECAVRLNLGLVLVEMAVEADELSSLPDDRLYTSEALIVVEDAPDECLGKLGPLSTRLTAVLGDSAPDGEEAVEDSDVDSGEAKPTDESGAAKLQDQMTQGKAEQNAETSDGKRKKRDPVDRPW